MYDKKAQYLEKHQQIPEEIENADFGNVMKLVTLRKIAKDC